MIKTLTDRLVASPSIAGNVFDAKTRGLVLRVGTRKRTWCFTYRNGGPPQWLKLGEYPALSLADARKRVNEERANLDNGVDPVEEKRKAAEPPPELPPAAPVFTFSDFVPAFIAFQKNRKVKEWKNDAAKIERHILPVWGPLPLKDITRTHVKELLDTVAGKGLTVGVNRIHALVSRIFTVALNDGLIEAHPAARLIKRFGENAGDRVLSDAEIRTLWAGLDARPGAASDAVRLRLLLGQRGEETAGMLWTEIDLEAALWALPAERTKNKRPHVVALTPAALTVITRRLATAVADETRVFPALSLQGTEHASLRAIHGGAYVWKDLRRTVGTRLAELGFDEAVVDRVLNHAIRGTVTRKHYNKHAYADEIRQALTAWDTELQRILANEPKSKTNVLPMRSR